METRGLSIERNAAGADMVIKWIPAKDKGERHGQSEPGANHDRIPTMLCVPFPDSSKLSTLVPGGTTKEKQVAEPPALNLFWLK